MRIVFFPDEILLDIFSALNYTTAVALTGTHVRFWNLVNPMTFYSEEQKLSNLKYAQANFPRFKGQVVCLICFRILPHSRFPPLKLAWFAVFLLSSLSLFWALGFSTEHWMNVG
jgi:hypothetical protein